MRTGSSSLLVGKLQRFALSAGNAGGVVPGFSGAVLAL